MSNYNYKSNISEIQLIHYRELKLLVKESINPLRELTPTEKERLCESLLSEKCINSALILQGSLITGYTIVDGFSRWGLLPEVIKQCPEFNTLIPVILKSHLDENEVKLYALRNQISRRNFSPMEVSDAILTLQNTGLTKTQALEEIAALTDSSVSSVKRKLNPSYAEKERQRQENIRSSKSYNPYDTEKVQVGLFHSSVENINSSVEINNDNSISVDTEPKTAQEPLN